MNIKFVKHKEKHKENQAQYDLDREAAKISALSSEELEKYGYLTGEDLGYKQGVDVKAKFEYSPLGKVSNKGLDKEYKKEGLLKRQCFKNQCFKKSVLRNGLKLYDRRTIIINAFIKNIYFGEVQKDVYYWDEEPKFEE